MNRVKTTVDIALAGGGKWPEVWNLEVEAWSDIEVVVPAGESVVAAVNAGDADRLHLFSLSASNYGVGLTFDAGGGAIVLGGPLLLSGAAIAELLGGSPANITFDDATEDVTIQILVGRDVTPP